MTTQPDAWASYLRWNQAIADVVFSSEAAGRHVYLDLEDDVLKRIRDIAEADTGDAAASLAEAVKDTLVLGCGPSHVLSGHHRRLTQWHDGTMLDPPPTLALLALLSLVAEGMSDMTPAQLEELAVIIGDATDRPARYVARAAEGLCAMLPPLSQARRSLPTTTLLAARSYEAWNPWIARFEPATATSRPGAYRLNGFKRTYVYRNADDISATRATVGDARIVKYMAAADTGQSLVGYDADTEVLYVPLGADLPGLYGRSAVLCSGYLPTEDPQQRTLKYRGVPAKIAAHLSNLLMS